MATITLAAAPKKAPTAVQSAWLRRGLDQPGGKLPLFDENGKQLDARTIRICLDRGWCEPWFKNPMKPDWLVCKLTEAGRAAAGADPAASESAQAFPSLRLVSG